MAKKHKSLLSVGAQSRVFNYSTACQRAADRTKQYNQMFVQAGKSSKHQQWLHLKLTGIKVNYYEDDVESDWKFTLKNSSYSVT